MNQQTSRAIPALRWWIGAALFASTIINYIDRQTLSLLAPYLKADYHWSNTDYAYLVIAFRLAYSIGQTVLGRLIDRIGTRQGLTEDRPRQRPAGGTVTGWRAKSGRAGRELGNRARGKLFGFSGSNCVGGTAWGSEG